MQVCMVTLEASTYTRGVGVGGVENIEFDFSLVSPSVSVGTSTGFGHLVSHGQISSALGIKMFDNVSGVESAFNG